VKPDERFLFDLHGYVVIDDALSANELEEARVAHARLTGETPTSIVSVPMGIEHDDLFLRLAAHPPMLERIRDLVGPHPKLIDNDVVATPLTEQALAWHRGVEPWGYAVEGEQFRCLMAKIIYYLTDCGPGDGPTRLVPGSHKQSVAFPVPEGADADIPGAIELHVRAGSALLFSEALLHAGSPNRSGRIRRLAIYNYGPAFVEHWEGYRPSAQLVARTRGELRELLGAGRVYHAPDPERLAAINRAGAHDA
jgi:ectoine hydroxylase-related dioxygenase (phytanoyl-CoA dioxygenase family)